MTRAAGFLDDSDDSLPLPEYLHTLRRCSLLPLVEISLAGTVKGLLDNLADGLSPDEIVANYPALSPEAIRAAIAYAAQRPQRN